MLSGRCKVRPDSFQMPSDSFPMLPDWFMVV
jgi:hypothetical protein